MSAGLEIRRARLPDLKAIGELVGEATRSSFQPDQATLSEWLFTRGVWLALREGAPAGVAAWQAENLVSVTDVLYVSGQAPQNEIAGKLMERIEAEAHTLMCEVSIVVLPSWTTREIAETLRLQGYKLSKASDLHRFWQEVLVEFPIDQRILMVKPLRGAMVVAPL